MKQLKALDSDKDLIAPFGFAKPKGKKPHHRRVMSARTNTSSSHVDEIITQAYFKEIRSGAEREEKLHQKKQSPPPTARSILS